MFPDIFEHVLKYIITAGFYNQHRSQFYLDSNAIECLLTLSNDCKPLFDSNSISSIIDIATSAIPELKSNYADKLVQALLKLATCLPVDEFAQKLNLIMQVVSEEPFSINPSPTDSLETRKKVGKAVMIWGAALNGLDAADIDVIVKVLEGAICSVVALSSKALAAYGQDEGIVLSVSILFKRLIRALKKGAVGSS